MLFICRQVSGVFCEIKARENSISEQLPNLMRQHPTALDRQGRSDVLGDQRLCLVGHILFWNFRY